MNNDDNSSESIISFLNLATFGDEGDRSILSKMTEADKALLRKMESHTDSALSLLDFMKSFHSLSNIGFWSLLGCLYIHGGYYSYIGPKQWRELFNYPIKGKEYIMKPFEHRVLSILPEQVECYRVHHPQEKDWISYTISEWAAKRIALDYQKHNAFESIEKFVVNKKDISFYFGRTGEDEIIILDRNKAKSKDIMYKTFGRSDKNAKSSTTQSA